MAGSDVADIKRTIAAEYMAGYWGLSGLASGVSRHTFITARMERMGDAHKELARLVGSEEQATAMVVTTLAPLPEKPERYHIPDVLRHIRGDTEATAHLIDYIEEMWETIDLLVELLGKEDAHKIISAPGFPIQDLPEDALLIQKGCKDE